MTDIKGLDQTSQLPIKDNESGLSLDSEEKKDDDFVFPDLYDFSNREERAKYHPDTVITASCGTKLYFHIVLLADVPFFDKMYNGKMSEAKDGLVTMNFSKDCINMYFNYIYTSYFEERIGSAAKINIPA